MPGAVAPLKAEVTGLFRDILESGLSLRVKVTGRSMSPFLRGGEVVTIKKVPLSGLGKGDIVFVDGRPGPSLLHRLVRKKRIGKERFIFQTGGDALISLDAPVGNGEILGKVCQIERVGAGPTTEFINVESLLQRKASYLRALLSLLTSYLYFGRQRLYKRKNYRPGGPGHATTDIPLRGDCLE